MDPDESQQPLIEGTPGSANPSPPAQVTDKESPRPDVSTEPQHMVEVGSVTSKEVHDSRSIGSIQSNSRQNAAMSGSVSSSIHKFSGRSPKFFRDSVSDVHSHHSVGGRSLQDVTHLCIPRRGSNISEKSEEDGFHQPTTTVIIPMNSVSSGPAPPAIIPEGKTSLSISHGKKSNRFSVSSVSESPLSHRMKVVSQMSPTQSVTSSHKSSHARPPSVTSSHRSSHFGDRHGHEPETQFSMSEILVVKAEDADPVMNGLPNHLILSEENLEKFDRHVSIDPQNDTEVMIDEGMELDDILFNALQEVDENQRTVQSMFSVNTQDSATFEHAPLQCGNIKFVKDSDDIFQETKKHYMCVEPDTPMIRVTDFMAKYWGKRNPKIVLSVISAVDFFKPWKNQRLKDDFQKGVIKAANTTEMWILTNGIDQGVPKMIGDAVREFNIEQANTRIATNLELSRAEQRRKQLTVMGIVPKATVPYGMYFDGTEGVQVRNRGIKHDADIYELNPDHTHFIMVDEEGKDPNSISTRCFIEQQFRNKIGRRKLKRHMSMDSGDEAPDHNYQTKDRSEPNKKIENPAQFIPIVGLLVQGSPKNIDHVLFYLQNKMPVVVLKGSGGIADMLVHVYEELQEKGEADLDYEDNFLKPELLKIITKVYSSFFDGNDRAKFDLRDKIIQCVKVATEGDGESTFLTVVNMKGWGASMRDLDKSILKALFKSENKEDRSLREQLQNDLQLTIDWNCPDLAWEIFQHDHARARIDKKMFEQCLLQKERGPFIDLFLTQGIKVHKYLNHRKLKLLFEKAEDREYFVNICLEGVLGITLLPNQHLHDSFLSDNLNRLIYKLAWISNFIQPYELSMSATGLYIVNSTIAERKALNILIIWAVLMNRHKLAKILWNRCDEPIGVALICSRIYKELTKYKMEQYQRIELDAQADEFGKMALGALSICWRDSSIQAYNMLGKRLPDFNNKSVIEIAHDAGYKHFLAHPCCQKWLTKMFHGQLQIKELDWGFMRLPYWFKILSSVFLIFPMYIWITFVPLPKKRAVTVEDDMSAMNEDSDSDYEDDYIPHTSKSTFDKGLGKSRSASSMNKRRRDVPFYRKIYLLWTAPITKFWLTTVAYFAFLGVFCLATLWPTCGSRYLDMVLWIWTAVIELELVCRVYRKYHKYKTLSLVGNCIDIFIIMIFLVLLFLTRIYHIWHNYIHAKTFMSYGLIYFFYRLLGVYLPISPTLGPMLLRMNRMVKHDFVAFIRMFMIFMIVGGVTIQAVVYPNWPLNMELFKKVITRPIYAMFLTQVTDLDGDRSCSPKYKNLSGYCLKDVGMFYKGDGTTEGDKLVDSLAECPYSSFSGYVITLQYLLICKLVLVTLLFAMFSLTIGKIDKEASEIWKFQRYALIADFIERFSLPPPFTVLCLLYLILKQLIECITHCTCRIRGIKSCCVEKDIKKVQARRRETGSTRARLGIDDTVFWKRVAREYVINEEAKLEKEDMANKQGDILVTLQEDLRFHRKSMKRLSDRVVELERMINSSRLYLEDISHKMDKTDVKGITNVKGRYIHVAARQSPYPTTRLTRFPVFDKYVPWEMVYDVYDPKTFTMKREDFPETDQCFVDEDILNLRKLRDERALLSEDDTASLTPIPDFSPKWNSVVTYKEKGIRRDIDRRSWINVESQPLRYTIDPLDLPQNPLGRTGIKGKGNLWRWGPNHVIKAVVTRWRRRQAPDLTTMPDFLYVEAKRVLEFIAIQKEGNSDSNYSLPGDVLHGLNNPYSILCKACMKDIFDEADKGRFLKYDQSDMIEFFSQFGSDVICEELPATLTVDPVVSTDVTGDALYELQPFLSESKANLRTETDSMGFSATLLYKGYLDDPRNTDNAWVEAEVWNFHYDIGDNFDTKITEESGVKWKEVSPYVKMFANETTIVQEAARIHDAYY